MLAVLGWKETRLQMLKRERDRERERERERERQTDREREREKKEKERRRLIILAKAQTTVFLNKRITSPVRIKPRFGGPHALWRKWKSEKIWRARSANRED